MVRVKLANPLSKKRDQRELAVALRLPEAYVWYVAVSHVVRRRRNAPDDNLAPTV